MSVIAQSNGSWGSRSLPLPNGYVINGNQVIQGTSCADGASSISIYPYVGVYITFDVRKSN